MTTWNTCKICKKIIINSSHTVEISPGKWEWECNVMFKDKERCKCPKTKRGYVLQGGFLPLNEDSEKTSV